MGIALGIDIETELEAIKNGECAGCRRGFTHTPDKPCYKFLPSYKKMDYCGKCNHMFYPGFSVKCPVCNPRKEVK